MSNPNHASKIETGNMRVEGTLTAGNLMGKDEWVSYTPTVISGGTFATSATLRARYKIQGTSLKVSFYYQDSAGTAGASTGTYRVSLPSGVTLSSARANTVIGPAYASEATTPKLYTGVAYAGGTTSPYFSIVLGNEATTPAAWGNDSPLATALNLNTAADKSITAIVEVEIERSSTILTSLAK